MGKGSTNKSSKHQLLCCSNIKWKFHEISMLGSSSIQISVKTNPNFRRAMKPARSQLSGCHDFQLAKVRVRYTFKVGEKGDPVTNHNFSQTNHQIQYYSIHLCLVFNDVTFKSYSIHGWFSGLERHFKVNFLERQVSASVSLCLAPLSKPGHPATVPLESLKFGMNRGFQQTVQRSFGLNFF